MLPIERINHLFCSRYRVQVCEFGSRFRRHQFLQVGGEPEHADRQSAAVEYGKRLDRLDQFFVMEKIIGAQGREVRLPESFCQSCRAVVELMVAEGDGVIVHRVHQPYLHIALEEVEIGRALREIAGVEQQQVGTGGTFLSDESLAAKEAADIGVRLVSIGLNLAVGVVGVQNGEHLCLGKGGESCEQACAEQDDCSFQHK